MYDAVAVPHKLLPLPHQHILYETRSDCTCNCFFLLLLQLNVEIGRGSWAQGKERGRERERTRGDGWEGHTEETTRMEILPSPRRGDSATIVIFLYYQGFFGGGLGEQLDPPESGLAPPEMGYDIIFQVTPPQFYNVLISPLKYFSRKISDYL